MALTEKLTAIADAIREKTGKTEAMTLEEMPTEIAGITGGESESNPDFCYVIFLSQDGSEEYGRRAVVKGDHCADPFEKGLFSTPKKESDVGYSYTFAGWATEINGSVDENWNLTVTENRNVYASYTATPRLYTVTYYDGETVLKTEQVAYGTIPVYLPEKEGYGFEGWEPALVAVTGDTSYSATWSEKITFANASWAKINEICEAGEASQYFAVGDTKTFVKADGSNSLQLYIIGIDFDNKYDGSGKAGITVAVSGAYKYGLSVAIPQTAMHTGTLNYSLYSKWRHMTFRSWLRNGFLTEYIPEDLRQYIKPVRKETIGEGGQYGAEKYTDVTSETVFIPSMPEMGGTMSSDFDVTEETLGTYPYFDSSTKRKLYDRANSKYVEHISRSIVYKGTNYNILRCFKFTVSGGTDLYPYNNYYDLSYSIPCFCI